MYPYKDQKIIDIVLRHDYAKTGLPISTVIFSDQEAWPHEWYIDALAVDPDHWGEKIASHLLDEAEMVAAKQGYHILSLMQTRKILEHSACMSTKAIKQKRR